MSNTRSTSRVFHSLVLPVAALCLILIAGPAMCDDSPTLTLDAAQLREAKLARLSEALAGNQYERAVGIARELFITETDTGVMEVVAGKLIEAVRLHEGYNAALDEAKRLQTLYRHRRAGRPAMPFLQQKIADLEAGRMESRQAWAPQDLPAGPETARQAYEDAAFSLTRDPLPKVIVSLERVIAAYSALESDAGPRPNAQVIAEAVEAVKDVSISQGDTEQALRNLRRIADAYPKQEAGARAWFEIGNVHRAVWEIEQAEKAYLTVDKRYPRSKTAYDAMMAAADMYDDVAHTREDVYIYKMGYDDREVVLRNAIDAWKKSYEFYPDKKRKFETCVVIGAWFCNIGDYKEAHKYLGTVLRTVTPELADAREFAALRDAQTYYLEGNYKRALADLEKLVPICKDPSRKEQAEDYKRRAQEQLEFRHHAEEKLRETRVTWKPTPAEVQARDRATERVAAFIGEDKMDRVRYVELNPIRRNSAPFVPVHVFELDTRVLDREREPIKATVTVEQSTGRVLDYMPDFEYQGRKWLSRSKSDSLRAPMSSDDASKRAWAVLRKANTACDGMKLNGISLESRYYSYLAVFSKWESIPNVGEVELPTTAMVQIDALTGELDRYIYEEWPLTIKLEAPRISREEAIDLVKRAPKFLASVSEVVDAHLCVQYNLQDLTREEFFSQSDEPYAFYEKYKKSRQVLAWNVKVKGKLTPASSEENHAALVDAGTGQVFWHDGMDYMP